MTPSEMQFFVNGGYYFAGVVTTLLILLAAIAVQEYLEGRL